MGHGKPLHFQKAEKYETRTKTNEILIRHQCIMQPVVVLVQVAKDKADAAEVAGETPTDKSMFHGKSLKDYAGRSWLEAPKDLKADNDHCFLPKRWVHTWSGHTKGVNAIRSLPLPVVLAY